MSGEGILPCDGRQVRILILPSADEAQAQADNLRDMLAQGNLDQRVVRAAANALEAIALSADCPFPTPLVPSPVEGSPQ